MTLGLAESAAQDRSRCGGKAATLAMLKARGLPVPDGFVVPVDAAVDAVALVAATREIGGARFAVRSSALAEDLAGASYAGLYESYLNVTPAEVPAAVERCRDSGTSERVAAYRDHDIRPNGVAVLVQQMVAADAAGVAFTANPITGERRETVITAVAGLAEALVSGKLLGEEWSVRDGVARCTRPGHILTRSQARQVADLAGLVQRQLGGPQDIEWAFAAEQLFLLQARPMTSLPDQVSWDPPGRGLWVRHFRLGEWLPDPATPLFVDWLLPRLEEGFDAGMRETAGASVALDHAIVNGWYYTQPAPPLTRLPAAVWRSRGRVLAFVVNALVKPGSDPAAADRALLDRLYRHWHDQLLPAYRELASGSADPGRASTADLIAEIDLLGRTAGHHLWYLAVLGGSAWKMEGALTRFLARHGPSDADLPALLRGFDTVDTGVAGHAVYSLDWYHDTAPPQGLSGVDPARRARLRKQREDAEAACRRHLSARPKVLAAFDDMLAAAQKYAGVRELQARELTLPWPRMRVCVLQLGRRLADDGALDDPTDIFFLTRPELARRGSLATTATGRRATWQRQRQLNPPLAIGTAPQIVGRHLERILGLGQPDNPEALLTGQPASGGRATGPVRVVDDPAHATHLQPGDILVARATTPAWTPLFSRIAAVVTDGGTAAAHASLIAREYGIPAVVGTQTATRKLSDGQRVIVDGTHGLVLPASAPDV